MTDQDINFLLAQAVGWTSASITDGMCLVHTGDPADKVQIPSTILGKEPWTVTEFRVFDYRDWSVIGPIAAKYSTWPSAIISGDVEKSKTQGYTDVSRWEVIVYDYKKLSWVSVTSDDPQKAIALATIKVLK
jgi:hypothetical protein